MTSAAVFGAVANNTYSTLRQVSFRLISRAELQSLICGNGLRMKVNGLFLFIILLLVYSRGVSQTSFRNIGLNNAAITCFAEDSLGFWIGTRSGLYRYSGNNFTLYSKENSALSSNDISCLSLDQENNLWVGTIDGGVNIYVYVEDSFRNLRYDGNNEHSISSNKVYVIYKDLSGTMWVGSDRGLNRFDLRKNQFYRYPKSDLRDSTSYPVKAIAGFKGGALLIGTLGDGLQVFYPDQERFESMGINGNSSRYIYDIANIKNATYLLACDKGVLEFDYLNNIAYDFSARHSIAGLTNITDIEKDKYGDIWIASDGDGLIKISDLNRKSEQVFAFIHNPLQSSSLGSNLLYKVYPDRLGNLWIGSERGISEIERAVNPTQPINIRYELTLIWRRWWPVFVCTVTFILLLIFSHFSRKFEKLRAKLQLEELEKKNVKELLTLKQTFFANVSHDIRTPLTLILGSVNRLYSAVNAKTGDKIAETVAVIQKNGTHLMSLMGELLELDKVASNNVQLKITQNDFIGFVHEVFLSFKTEAEEKQIDYAFHSDVDQIILWFDNVQLEKVIYNILSNAFKFTFPYGKITVGIEQDDEWVSLVIRDSGIGIPIQKKEEIFDRFYQAEQNQQQNNGYGIGLSIAKEIIRLHKGTISVSSAPQSGSVFTIQLLYGINHFKEGSLIENNVGDPHKDILIDHRFELTKAPVDGLGQVTVLIVEDHLEIRKYLSEFLNDFNVLEAENGVVGLETARQVIPDIIVSDVIMPEMDGITLTRELKKDMRTSHIPIILLTARTSLIYKNEGFQTGADDYITKPFSEQLLRTRIVNLLINRRLLNDRFQKMQLIEPKELLLPSNDEKFLRSITQIIEHNIEVSEINTELFIKELGMSHSVVYRKLKGLTGLSIIEFVRDFKLKRAAQLMTHNDISISDICFHVGFADRRYFSTVFKKKFGQSPSEYIRAQGHPMSDPRASLSE